MEAKCAFFLALLGCLEIVCIEGRPFWPKNTEQFINEIEEANYQKRELGEQPNQPSTPPAENEQKTPPNYIDSAGHSVAGSDSGFAAYNHKDDFRPTTPGNSPGVGHKYTNSRAQIEQKARKFFTAGTKDDFRPTAPDHIASGSDQSVAAGKASASSAAAYYHKDEFRPTTPGPGINHKFTKDIKPKGRKFVTTGTKDDYRPTAPGHSPGVGHHLQVENAKPSP